MSTPTMTRRRQRRPDLQGEYALPSEVASLIQSVHTSFASANVQRSPPLDTKAQRVHALITAALLDMSTSCDTPEQQLHAISKINGAVCEDAKIFHSGDTLHKEGQLLVFELALPLLLDCRVRYLHRALMTLLRALVPSPPSDEVLTQAETLIRSVLVSSWSEKDTEGRSRLYLLPEGHAEALYGGAASGGAGSAEQAAAALSQYKDRVMHFLNSVDGLTSTLMPMMPSIFQRTFLEIFPLLADCFQWVVMNATGHRRVLRQDAAETDAEEADSGTVFGEDLEHVRFCVRVVATYTHKFLDCLRTQLATGPEGGPAEADVARLLRPAAIMLTKSFFPKDVLNAVGLLVASILTVRTCDAWLVGSVCGYIAASVHRSFDRQQSSSSEGAPLLPLRELFDAVSGTIHVVCAPSPREACVGGAGRPGALELLFTQLTPNACFALLKGILAHFSSPIRGDVTTVGLLMRPTSVVAPDGEKCVEVIHDVVLPAAERYCSAVQEPETRFMAIQAVDSIVRYVSSVLLCVEEVLIARGQLRGEKNGSKKGKAPHEAVAALTDADLVTLKELYAPSAKMHRTLLFATQLVMGLWDDGTQQMSGALYGTYNEVLNVNEALKRLRREGGAKADTEDVIDTEATLHHILDVQSDRRGKYHALLGLLSVMPLRRYVEVITAHFDTKKSATVVLSATEAMEMFSRQLLSGASNHKIGNVAGDLFASIARLLGEDPAAASRELLRGGLLLPLARAIAVEGYVSIASNVTDAVNISHLTAHFVSPLVKQSASHLHTLVELMLNLLNTKDTASGGAATASRERVDQGIVETLARARAVGVGITDYLHPSNPVLRVLQESTQSLNYELRNAAMCLCVLGSKNVDPIEPWQSDMVAKYLALNLQLGGDSTAYKGLHELFRKWVRRLTESYLSKGKAQTGTEKKKKAPKALVEGGGEEGKQSLGTPAYRAFVVEHCDTLARLLTENIGLSLTISSGLSVERRVAAMSAYAVLLHALVALFAKDATTWDAHLAAWFPACVVPSLVANLSDGWSHTRTTAGELLGLFARYSPDAVVAGSKDGSDAEQEVLRARTYRNAEGAVQRYMLYVWKCGEAKRQLEADPTVYADQLLAKLAALQGDIRVKCAAMSQLRGSAAYGYIQSYPLHGSLSLCTEILRTVAEMEPMHHVSSFESACEGLFRSCCQVLRVCSTLVGTEAGEGHSGDGGLADNEVVDCRGHVYDREKPEAEGVMRCVVNNTWLSMRLATHAIEVVATSCAINRLPLDGVREVCYALLHALLHTKHNGVMRCVRGALRVIVEAVVRTRDSTFYHLPSELLQYLLGPEGVASGDLARMLRRSQGLPHAILAVLEAEDAAVPFVMFPHAMRYLLALARPHETAGLSEEVYRSQRSNALNVLKFVFEDKMFADRVVAYVEEAFSIATDGFNDGSWYIRNSSLMLFSAVIHRFVGEHPSMGGAGVNTSLHDTAKRTPRGVAYVYEELRKGAALLEKREMRGDAAELSLFPVLQMLSMLSPDPPHLATKATGGEQDNTMRMVEAVLGCTASKNLMIRAASAVALSSLVPIAAIPSIIQLQSHPLAMRDGTVACATPLSAAEKIQSSSLGNLNGCHGALLQLLQFHSIYCGTLRRHFKQKRSSYATDAVSRAVSMEVALVLMMCEVPLLRAAAVCPVVASSLLALCADLLHFGPASMELERMATFRNFAAKALLASRAWTPLPVDRESVCDAAGLVLLLLVLNHDGVEPVNMAAVHSNALLAASETLDVSRGGHHILSWFVAHVHYYTSVKPVLSAAGVRRAIVDLRDSVSCDIVRLVFESLGKVVHHSSSSPPAGSPLSLGCVSWEQLVHHLRFAAFALSRPGLVAPSTAVGSVCDALVGLLEEVDSLQLNADTCSAALGVVVAYSTLHKKQAPASLVEVLAACAHPDRLVHCRLAVIHALEKIFSFCEQMQASPFATPVAQERGELLSLATGLCCILFRLLLDDTADVRAAAAEVCSHAMWGPTASPRDPLSCLLSLSLVLQSHARAGGLTVEEARQRLLEDADMDEPAEAEEEEEDGDDDGDVLFQKESNNMFMESTVVHHLFSVICGGSCAEEEGDKFSVVDKMLKTAEAAGSCKVSLATH